MALDDNQKIGIGLIILGFIFIFLGIILFFDASLIAIGNLLFLAGLVLSIGVQRTLKLFTRKEHIRGTVCFFAGIALVVCRWGILGILVECFGFLNLFGNFIPTVVAVGRQVPGLGTVLNMPIVSQIVDVVSGKTLPKYSV